MARESTQKKIGRVRPPRVHITYDVDTGGAIEKREIPFIVSVLTDLAGQPEKPLPPVKNRKFVEIDRDNFDQVMRKIGPRLTFKVDNKLTDDDTRIGVELKFQSLADFEPQNVVKQVEPLRKLLELRAALANLRSSLSGNDQLESLLLEVVGNTEALKKLNEEASGSGPSAGSADASKE